MSRRKRAINDTKMCQIAYKSGCQAATGLNCHGCPIFAQEMAPLDDFGNCMLFSSICDGEIFFPSPVPHTRYHDPLDPYDFACFALDN